MSALSLSNIMCVNRVYGKLTIVQSIEHYGEQEGTLNSVDMPRGIWLILIKDSTFVRNHALRGGGIAVICRDFATQNTMKVLEVYVFHNSVVLGGGVYAILQDSSINNFIHFTHVTLFNNTAHRGRGMFVHIQDTTATNRVEIFKSPYLKNTLLPC